MDYKDVFLMLVVVAISTTALISFADDLNASYGTSIGSELSTEVEEIRVGIIGNLSETGADASVAGSAEEGAESGEGETSLIQRARRIMGIIPNLVGLPGKLIDIAGAKLGVPPWTTQLFKYLFIFTFFITLAYLFITGSKRLLS